jgi:hypothetical protein
MALTPVIMAGWMGRIQLRRDFAGVAVMPLRAEERFFVPGKQEAALAPGRIPCPGLSRS